MIIAAFDVHYPEDGRASAAAVLFHDYRDPGPAAEYTLSLPSAADYIPGQFYRRELPCILALIEQFEENPHEMVVDGYVRLGDRPGLGWHLFEFFQGKIPVIGVAKSPFIHSGAIPVLRGRSRKPLYVTSAGVDTVTASKRILAMHGPHRVPSLLKRVDLLGRGKACDPRSCSSG
ncbi:MAG: endonuclease V [Deltaproteobacteria bacterium]|nr:endonuclease V [Deltaproteobacteria bacterium]